MRWTKTNHSYEIGDLRFYAKPSIEYYRKWELYVNRRLMGIYSSYIECKNAVKFYLKDLQNKIENEI